VAFGLFQSWLASSSADQGINELWSKRTTNSQLFDAKMLDGLPEIARRYFSHAIAAGTPLQTVVELSMHGTFTLGEKGNQQSYNMTADRCSRLPDQFVWSAQMRSGPLFISGSDALIDGRAWANFWLEFLVPVVNERSSSDVVRSARSRPAMESIWAPAGLLPGNGMQWEQTGQNTARLRFSDKISPVGLTIDDMGRVLAITTQRWSNANQTHTYQLQPFGGTVRGEATFDGYTIPDDVEIGNLFGTPDYTPFFRAKIGRAWYQ
jgi:hypothetical protein